MFKNWQNFLRVLVFVFAIGVSRPTAYAWEDVDVSGNIVIQAAPANLRNGQNEGANIKVIREGIWRIDSSLSVDILMSNLDPSDLSSGGNYIINSILDIDNNGGQLGPGLYEVYYIHFDTVDDSQTSLRAGLAVFDREIKALVLVNNRNGYFNLQNTDPPVFGFPGTLYPIRGTNAHDFDLKNRNGSFHGGDGSNFDRCIVRQDLRGITFECRNTARIDSMRVIVAAPGLATSVSPQSFPETGSATLTVTRQTRRISQPLVVSLISSDTTEATVPPTLTIPANQASATVTISGVHDFENDGTKNVTITATAEDFHPASSIVSVTNVNRAPVVQPIPAQSVVVCQEFRYDVIANDPDNNALTYQLLAGPAGSSIHPTTGRVTWPTPLSLTPGNFSVRVVDNGIPNLSSNTVNFVVSVIPGTLTSQVSPSSVPENGGDNAATLTITRNTCIDRPMSVTVTSDDSTEATVPATAQFGAGDASIQIPVRAEDDFVDDGTRPVTLTANAFAFNSTSSILNVTSVNHAPEVQPIDNQSVVVCEEFVYDVIANDTDNPQDNLSYELIESPEGAMINSETGRITWLAPQEIVSEPFVVRVVDDGSPNLASQPETFTVTVGEAALTCEVNVSTIREDAGDSAAFLEISRTECLDEEMEVSIFSSDETEATIQANATFFPGETTISIPIRAEDDFEDDGEQTVIFTVTATGFSSANSALIVTSVNHAPVLDTIEDQSIRACEELQIELEGTDPDNPADQLTYELVQSPADATINMVTGEIQWVAPPLTIPGEEIFTVRVLDDGVPRLSDEKSFTVLIEPALVVNVPVTSFTPTRGIYVRGGIADLFASDNADLTMRNNPRALFSVNEIEFAGQSATTEPCIFEISVEASVFARTDVVQTVSLFDYDAQEFVEVEMSIATRFNDSVTTTRIEGDLARFVSSTGEIRGRLRFESLIGRQRFSANIDQIFWSIGD